MNQLKRKAKQKRWNCCINAKENYFEEDKGLI